MRRFSFSNVRSINVLFATLSVTCLAMVFCFIYSSLQSVEESNSSYARMLASPINGAKRIGKFLENSFSDLQTYSDSPDEAALADLFSRSSEVWERDRYVADKKEWTEKRFQLPLYREVVMASEVNGKCVFERVWRNENSQYSPQSEAAPLFPFDEPCKKLRKQDSYVSNLLAWYTTREEQMGDTTQKDPAHAMGKTTYVDGIIRIGKRVEQGGKNKYIFLALDFRHIYNAVIHYRAYPKPDIVLPGYQAGDYSFVLDPEGWFLVHPKLWNIRGYVRGTSKLAEAWPWKGDQKLPVKFDHVNREFPPKMLNPPLGDEFFVLGGKYSELAIYSYKNLLGQVKNRISTPIRVSLPGIKVSTWVRWKPLSRTKSF